MDTTGLKQMHEQLSEIFERLVLLPKKGWPDGISQDTVFALGHASGVVSKAKALIGRDIDQASAEPEISYSVTRSGFA